MESITTKAWAVIYMRKEANLMGIVKPEEHFVGAETNDNGERYIYADLAFFFRKRDARIHMNKITGWKLQKVKPTITPQSDN